MTCCARGSIRRNTDSGLRRRRHAPPSCHWEWWHEPRIHRHGPAARAVGDPSRRRGPAIDLRYLVESAQAHEAHAADGGGFDRVLIGWYSNGPDGLQLAANMPPRIPSAAGLPGGAPAGVPGADPWRPARSARWTSSASGGRAAIHVDQRAATTPIRCATATATGSARPSATPGPTSTWPSCCRRSGPRTGRWSHDGTYYRFQSTPRPSRAAGAAAAHPGLFRRRVGGGAGRRGGRQARRRVRAVGRDPGPGGARLSAGCATAPPASVARPRPRAGPLQPVVPADPRRARRKRPWARRPNAILERREATCKGDRGAWPDGGGGAGRIPGQPTPAGRRRAGRTGRKGRLYTAIARATGRPGQHHRAGRHAGAGGGSVRSSTTRWVSRPS